MSAAWEQLCPQPRPGDRHPVAIDRVPPVDAHLRGGNGLAVTSARRSDRAIVTFAVPIAALADAAGAPATAVAVLAAGWLDTESPRDVELECRGDEWVASFEVDADWQVSYRFAVHRGPDPPPWRADGLRSWRDRAVADPGNPRSHSATGGVESSVLWLPGAGDRPWLRRFGTDEVADRLDLGGDGDPPLWSWVADGAASDAPLLVLFDGEVHATGTATTAVFADAVADGILPPFAAVCVGNPSRQLRPQVLGVPDGLVRFVGERLLPAIDAGVAPRLGGARRPRSTIVSGSSFGALSALFALARYPSAVDAAIAQSTSLWRYRDGAVAAVVDAAIDRRHRIRLQAGRDEGTMVAAATAFADDLADGVDVAVDAVSGAHDWAWWVPELIAALAELTT